MEKKKTKKSVIVLIVILVVLFFLTAAGLLVANYYLDKFVYDNETNVQIDTSADEKINLNPEDKEADNEIAKNLNDNVIWYNENVYNILLIGADKGTVSIGQNPRSDAMILISINKADKQIKMVSMLRAAYVAIPGYNHSRLNAAHSIGGPKLLIDTIEQNYKIHIDNYISVDFEAFQKIIDILGGVDIKLTDEEARVLATTFKQNGLKVPTGAGTYHMDGNTTLAYVRLREIDFDRMRTQRQRNVLTQIAYKARTMSFNQAVQLLDEILPLVTTDLTKTEIVSHAVNALNYVRWPITQDTIPHSWPKLVYVPDSPVEVLLLDWTETKRYIHELLYPNMEPQEIPAR